MKRIVCITVLIISLCGCTVKEDVPLECIADTICEKVSPSFYMVSDIPPEASLSASCDDGCCVVFSHSDYEIFQEVFSAESIDDAFIYLTGQSANELTPICVNHFPLEEYRFRWIAATDGTTIACSGKLFYDGQHCYSLVVQCPLSKQSQYEELFSDFIATANLQAV